MSARAHIPRRLLGQIKLLWRLQTVLLGALVAGTLAAAQDAGIPEIITQEGEPQFKIKVQRNVVLVRVVVRDKNGRPVGGLSKEDFRLFDNGKPQVISQFTVESSAPPPEETATRAPGKEEPESLSENPVSPPMPRNYLGLYFDDTLMSFEDVARTRDAVEHYLASGLRRDDRVGLFTTSGRTVVDFTDDRAKLDQALSQLRPHPITDIPETCPDIKDYQAYLIVYRHDPAAMDSAKEEAFTCFCADLISQAQALCESQLPEKVMGQAIRVLSQSENQIEYSLRGLDGLVRRMTILPGRHNIIFISPGFMSNTMQFRVEQLAERALRANVVINSFDCKGLYVDMPAGDSSQRGPIIPVRKPYLAGRKELILMDSMRRSEDVLRVLASDTGGQLFINSNDLIGGFRRLGTLADVSYLLAFSPLNLKNDGRFHNLKVELGKPAGLSVQARRGYFAPQKGENPAVQAKNEIEHVVFSQDEMNELAVDVHTQFFKMNDADAQLSVLVRLDPRALRFHKEQGRNLDNVTFVTAIFDRDGKYVMGREKKLDFHLRDASLAKLQDIGINLKTSFKIKAGTYTVRQVVRDGDGGQMSGVNRVVKIPY